MFRASVLPTVRRMLIDGGTGAIVTERDFEARVDAAVLALRRRGVRAGDTVLVCLPVGADLLVAVHAVIALGAVAYPLGPPMDPDRVRATDARVMITDLPEEEWLTEVSRIRVVMGLPGSA